MSEDSPPQAKEQFWRQARDIRRALLVTAFFERRREDGGFENVPLSDQMRRLVLLLNELSYGAEEPCEFAFFEMPGAWVGMARCLSMDSSDVQKAVKKLVEFGVAAIEEGDGFVHISLRAAKLAVAGRALIARAAIDEAELSAREHREQLRLVMDLPGCERSLDQAKGFGFAAALDAVQAEEDRETLAQLRAADGQEQRAESGRVPDPQPPGALPGTPQPGRVPERSRGESPSVAKPVGEIPRTLSAESGRVPEPYTRARADSVQIDTDRRFVDSGESGAVAPTGGSGRFRDSNKNYLFERLAALDALGDLADETCRRTWVGRIRDHAPQIDEAIGEVKAELLEGKKLRSPLGRIYLKAQKFAKALGRELRSILFT